MAIRLVLVDGDVCLSDLEGVEVRRLGRPLEAGATSAHEVLVVSADLEVLAQAGERGFHRLLAAGPERTAAVVAELVAELARARTTPSGGAGQEGG